MDIAANRIRNIETTGNGEAGWCASCHEWMPDGPDACLGVIPGVSHACCGHGRDEVAYVILGGEPLVDCDLTKLPSDEWLELRGEDALEFFRLIRKATRQ